MFGPYVLTRALTKTPLAARWVALHEGDQSSHLLYRFAVCQNKAQQATFVSAIDAQAALRHAHLLEIEQYSFDVGGRPWAVTPYPGDAVGLLTLERLLREKGGRTAPEEAAIAITQVLETCAFAHQAGEVHGTLALDDVLIDRRGSLQIELYGMRRRLAGQARFDREVVRDEVRSVVEIAYRMVTGLRAEEPIIPAGRLVKKLDSSWDAWLREGLNPTGGFETAAQALDRFQLARSGGLGTGPVVSVRSVFGKFKDAFRASPS